MKLDTLATIIPETQRIMKNYVYEMVEMPIRTHPKVIRERNKRKRERFVKEAKRSGIETYVTTRIRQLEN